MEALEFYISRIIAKAKQFDMYPQRITMNQNQFIDAEDDGYYLQIFTAVDNMRPESKMYFVTDSHEIGEHQKNECYGDYLYYLGYDEMGTLLYHLPMDGDLPYRLTIYTEQFQISLQTNCEFIEVYEIAEDVKELFVNSEPSVLLKKGIIEYLINTDRRIYI